MSSFGSFLQNPTQKIKHNFSNIILQSALRALAFFAFLYAVDGIFRAIFILNIGILERHLGGAESVEILQAFINGARYFGQIAGVLAIVAFVLFLCANIFRRICYIFIGFVICLLCFVNIANMGFYEIYGDVFNSNLLGLIFDDRSAIFATAQGGQYNIIFKIIAWILSSVIFVLIFRKIDWMVVRFCVYKRRIYAFLAFIIFALSVLFAINGRFGLTGISLGQEIRPTTNTFLRKISTGALRDLYIVARAYKKITDSKFSDFIDETPLQTAKNFAKFMGVNVEGESEINLLNLLQKQVGGGQNAQNHTHFSQNHTQNLKNLPLSQNHTQIKHIFYIIAESMSEWHFEAIFDEIDLSSELKKLVRQNGAYKAQTFLQNAGNTIASLNVQISGLLQTDIPLSLLGGKVGDLQTAPAVIMRDLGYEGRFFYGGSGTWQKIDSYVTTQGFSEILFGTHITQNAQSKGYNAPFSNSWGAYDNHLFAFVRDKIIEKTSQNPNAKTFNMIMTTSNHPPYDAPVAEFGAPMERIENFIKSHNDLRKKPITARILAHIWWQDKVIANFIREMSAKFPNSLFIVTGDHYDREYPFVTSFRTSQSVPLIVYAPNTALEVRTNIGAHIDITPTIVEIVAPEGFKYHSFGKAMMKRAMANRAMANRAMTNRAMTNRAMAKRAMAKRADSAKAQKSPKKSLQSEAGLDFALGFNAIATSKFIFDGFQVFEGGAFESGAFESKAFEGEVFESEANRALAEEHFKHLQRAKALSWWILQKGVVVD